MAISDRSVPDERADVLADAGADADVEAAVRRDIKEGDLISGIRVAGAAAYVEEITADATQALIY